MLFVDTRTNSYAVWKSINICELYLQKFLLRQLDITFNKGTLGENHNQILYLWWGMLLYKTSNTSSFVRRNANFVERQQQYLIHLSPNLLLEKSSVLARPETVLCPTQLMDLPGVLLVKTTFWYIMYSVFSLMSRTPGHLSSLHDQGRIDRNLLQQEQLLELLFSFSFPSLFPKDFWMPCKLLEKVMFLAHSGFW